MARPGTLPSSHIPEMRRLYYDKQLPAHEIAKQLGVHWSSVYKFMRRHRLPRRTPREQAAILFARKPHSFRPVACRTERQRKLKLAGILLYWCEGFTSQESHTVDFTNSKPEMVKIFVAFLRQICRIDEERLRGALFCYADQDVRKIERFWSRLTGIPRSRFTKPYVRSDFRLDKRGKLPYGVFHVRYSDLKLLNQIREWIGQETQRFAQS